MMVVGGACGETRMLQLRKAVPQILVLIPEILVPVAQILVIAPGNDVGRIVRDARGRELDLGGGEQTKKEIKGELHRVALPDCQIVKVREGDTCILSKLGKRSPGLISIT